MNQWSCEWPSVGVDFFVSWLVNINVYTGACLVPLLEFVLGTELVEELNSFVRTHCICWKISIKKWKLQLVNGE